MERLERLDAEEHPDTEDSHFDSESESDCDYQTERLREDEAEPPNTKEKPAQPVEVIIILLCSFIYRASIHHYVEYIAHYVQYIHHYVEYIPHLHNTFFIAAYTTTRSLLRAPVPAKETRRLS